MGDLDKKPSLADFKQTVSIEYQSHSKYMSERNASMKEMDLKKYGNEENSYSQKYRT